MFTSAHLSKMNRAVLLWQIQVASLLLTGCCDNQRIDDVAFTGYSAVAFRAVPSSYFDTGLYGDYIPVSFISIYP
jgi:hypothetical protein